jgi:hypothetical protein
MTAAKLNWSSAEVQEAKLTVGLEGELPKPWKRTFEGTVKRLGRASGWGEVSLSKRNVCVTEVTPGTEAKLRHYLESVIEQANATHPPEAPEDEDDGQGEQERGGDEGPDAEMRERFRSFAEDSAR